MAIAASLLFPISLAVDFHNIHGYVYDNNHDPVPDARVVITNERTGDTLEQFTDEKGFYNMELANMKHGWKDGDTLLINVSGTGYYKNWEGGKRINVDASTIAQRIDITLHRILKADFIVPKVIYAGNTTSFEDSSYSEYAIINYTWHFGDGSVAYGKNVSHVFDKAGDYDITLNIIDEKGHEDSITKKVYVSSIENEGNSTPAFEFLTLILIISIVFILRKKK
ncbi:MAG: PKD domain-containing protein [Thermoplasmata archaeon]|nr:PKD domain-containing protein [Thermoplasmata archaeon]